MGALCCFKNTLTRRGPRYGPGAGLCKPSTLWSLSAQYWWLGQIREKFYYAMNSGIKFWVQWITSHRNHHRIQLPVWEKTINTQWTPDLTIMVLEYSSTRVLYGHYEIVISSINNNNHHYYCYCIHYSVTGFIIGPGHIRALGGILFSWHSHSHQRYSEHKWSRLARMRST